MRRCSTVLSAHCSLGKGVVALLLLSCIILVGITFDAGTAEALLLWVQENKGKGAILFFCLYTLGVILMLPAMVMAMASGAIFGLMYGSVLAWAGSSIGQVIAFAIGRYLLREIVVSYLTTTFPKWTAIDKALMTDGWKLVTLLRLSPIAPWNVLNYALAVTSVPLAAYVMASSFSILPYLILFVYFGSLARNLADVFTGAAGLDTKTTITMGVVSALAMVGIVWYTTHISRKAVNQALQRHADELPPEITEDEEVAELLGQLGRRKDAASSSRVEEVAGPVIEMAPLVATHSQIQTSSGDKSHSSARNYVDSSNASPVSPSGFKSRSRSAVVAVIGHNNDDDREQMEDGGHLERFRRDEVLGVANDSSGEAEILVSANSIKTNALAGSAGYGLHVRSTHASPRSQSPRSARWQRSNEFL